ncbi:hypothetical protein ACYULU_05450, partial [Breznakiellaceae bacterium SP9]
GKYAGKSLPVILKNWKNKTPKGSRPKSVVIYADEYFGIFPFVGSIQEIRYSGIYRSCYFQNGVLDAATALTGG